MSTARAKGSYIAGSNGFSNGVAAMLTCFNSTARYVDQGGGKRKGAIAVYLEPWHPDLFDWLNLKDSKGPADSHARDLHLALWTPNLFMERIERDEMWSFMCPSDAPGLADVWGDEFNALYTRYEREGGKRIRLRLPARQVWMRILERQVASSEPYILYKDYCNARSNQKNLGTIRQSNLCSEVVQYTRSNSFCWLSVLAYIDVACFYSLLRFTDRS